MGLVNYLSQFLPHLATKSAPLTEMCGAQSTWDWTPLHDTAFQQVKDLVRQSPVLKPLDYNSPEPIYLITDASTIGTGAWIGQGSTLSHLIPAAFHSRKFNPYQQSYHTTDKELLAIVDALEHFRSVLSGTSFTILTDHKPLVTFLKQHDLVDDKHVRWQHIISQFDCTIQYLPGEHNTIADSLSRVYKNPGLSPLSGDLIPAATDPPTSKQLQQSPSKHTSNSPTSKSNLEGLQAAEILFHKYFPKSPTPPPQITSAATTRSQTKASILPAATPLNKSLSNEDTTASTSTMNSQSGLTLQQIIANYIKDYPLDEYVKPDFTKNLDDTDERKEAFKFRLHHGLMHWTACTDNSCYVHRNKPYDYKGRNPVCSFCGTKGHERSSCPLWFDTKWAVESEFERQKEAQKHGENPQDLTTQTAPDSPPNSPPVSQIYSPTSPVMSRPVTPIDSRPSDELEEGEIDESMQDIVMVETPLSPPPNSPPRPHHASSPGSTSPEPPMQLPTEVVTTFNSPQMRGIPI